MIQRLLTYLSRNNNFERQFMYTSQDAWETVPAIGMGINIAGKANRCGS